MAISDKTRKLLWGRSGGVCAICARRLTADATDEDPAAVLGEQCHIVGRSPGGPRYAALGAEEVDGYENLVLLCAHHHREVDDQPNHYTADRLRAKKVEHERRMAAYTRTGLPAMRFLEDPRHRVVRLKRIETGGELWSYITAGYESTFDEPEPEDETEVELLGGFIQNLADYADIHDDLLPGDHLRIKFELTQHLRELGEAGFAVYAGHTQRIVEVDGRREPWPGKLYKIVRLEESESTEAEPVGVG